jgi:hypothetical protein
LSEVLEFVCRIAGSHKDIITSLLWHLQTLVLPVQGELVGVVTELVCDGHHEQRTGGSLAWVWHGILFKLSLPPDRIKFAQDHQAVTKEE